MLIALLVLLFVTSFLSALLIFVNPSSTHATSNNACTNSVAFTIHNNCPYTIWPATLTDSGPPASSTGFELPSQAFAIVTVPASSSGRVWAQFVCNNDGGRFTCRSGDCGSGQIACNGAGATPPATLIEYTLASGGGKDFYDVSLVDGFNLPVPIILQGGFDCTVTDCPTDINVQCPGELAIKNSDGGTIGYKSACLAFCTPQYCCTGQYGIQETCKPTNYSLFFKNRCPKAYR